MISGPLPPAAHKQPPIPERIRAGLRTTRLGRSLYFYDRLASTNTTALELAEAGAPDGAVIVADYQTLGRGRMGRSWISPPNSNLHISIILRPDSNPARIGLWSLATAVAVAHTIKRTTGLPARLKWPNDILVRNRKISGLLLESAIQGDRIKFLVIGIGLNVNLDLDIFPESLRPHVTSLRVELGRETDRWDLLCRLLETLEDEYRLFPSEAPENILNAYAELSETLGRVVTVRNQTQVWTGTAIGLTPEGGLILQKEGLGHVVVRSDEVVHVSGGHASCD
jgi:BirA family transcriptional regulator, biotin operon repressor / biotin---[acetyl-CoA-carboxylase] ligase